MLGRFGPPVIAAFAALMIAGCGSGDTAVPEGQSDVLLSRLQGIEDAVKAGNCNLAEQQAQGFVDDVAQLQEVDPEVKDQLEEGASRLVDLASDPTQCVEAGATGVAGEQPSTTSTTSEETTSTTTTSTTAAETTGTNETGSGQQAPSGNQPGNDQPLQVPGGGQGGSSGTLSPGTGGVSGGGGQP